MKKIIVVVVAIFLLVMFLIYSGVFRDYTDPLTTVQYYLECIKNREGALTYQICSKGSFNEDRFGKLYRKHKMNLIERILLSTDKREEKIATVRATMIYKNGQEKSINLSLVKEDKIWKISSGLK